MEILLLTLMSSWAFIEAGVDISLSDGSCPRNEADQTVLATTSLGQLKGKILKSRGEHEFYAFLGIPFAEKPERFKPAQPVKPWESVRDALNYSSICPQYSGFLGLGDQVVGDEDCLYLNVFTPSDQRCKYGPEKLPVLFHIHGGAYVSGAGEFYDPLYFMDECIVYVSINYRLGALGFLTTNDGVIPGNLGLKDALLALKWTNQNIEHFRGNKNLITITGISAGAMAASHFIASPAAKGLFHGVIAQSGSSLTPIKQRLPNSMSNQRGSLQSADAQSDPSLAPLIQEDPKTNAFRLGQLLGCMDEESKALKACLESKSIEEIISNQKKITNWIVDTIRFFPVVEPVDAIEPFQTEEPYLRIKRGEGSRVPLITGVMKDEGILMNGYPTLGNPAAVEQLNNNWYEIAPIVYLYDHLKITVEERNKISDKIKEFYLGGKPVGPETAQGFINSESDRYFNLASWEESSLHSKYAPVYRYSMNFKSNYGLASQLFQLPEIVVSHADDIQYFYKSFAAIPPPEPESDRLRFSEMLIKLWVSFIKSGTPTDVFPNVEAWDSFTPKHPSTLILDFPAENVPDYKQERMEFWNSLKLRELEFPEQENIII